MFPRSSLLGCLLSDRKWWQRVFKATVEFSPRCLPCAALLAVSQVVIILTTVAMEFQLGKLKAPGVMGVMPAEEMLPTLISALVASVAALIALLVSLFALSDWMDKLTAFSRLLILSLSGSTDDNACEGLSASIASALQATRRRRWYLFKTWLVASAILLVPVLPLSVLSVFAILGCNKPALAEVASVLPSASLLTEPWLQAAAWVGCFVLTVITLLYSFVTIAFSSVSEMPAVPTALSALKQSLRNAGPLLIVTTLIFAANTLLAAPQSWLFLLGVRLAPDSAVIQVCAQIWFAACSLFLWPLSMAPFCRMAALCVNPSKD